MISSTFIRAAHPGDAGKLARIHVACWRATYQNLLPKSYLDQMAVEQINRTMQRGLIDPRNEYLVAEVPRGVVGYICGGPERTQDPIYRGEIYELYVMPENQHQGLGSLLLSALAHRLYRNDLFSLMVWVLAGNPNRRFYEKRNGLHLRTRSMAFAGIKIDAAAYGWIDATLAMND
jgi:ribosomal protein S18 acetylase RimI-like enzyme